MQNYWWIRLLPKLLQRHLQNRSTLQRIIGNSGWLLADNLLRMGIGLVVSAWVARYLGPDQFGLYCYAAAFVALFSSVATLGLDNIVVRDIVRDPSCRDETLGSAFLLKLAGGLATLLLTVVSISVIRPNEPLTRWLVGIIAAGTLFQSFDAAGFWFQAQIRSKFTVCAKNTAFLLIAVAKVVLILQQAPLIAFAWAGFAEFCIGAVGMMIAYRASGCRISAWRGSRHRAAGLLRDSWPLILSGVAIYVQARIDQVMLGEMLGNAEVGQYSAAMRLIEVFAFIPMVVQSSAAPVVTQAKIAGEIQYYERLCNVYRVMTLLFAVTAVPVFLFSGQIVRLVYGDQYREAGVLLSLFAIRLFFTNMGVAKSLFITNENLFRYALATALAGSAANVILNWILIPRYASVGAIGAMICSFFITTFFIDIFYVDVRKNLAIMVKGILTPWKLKLR